MSELLHGTDPQDLQMQASRAHLEVLRAEDTIRDADPQLKKVFERVRGDHLAEYTPTQLTPTNGNHAFGDRFRPVRNLNGHGSLISTMVEDWHDKTTGTYLVTEPNGRRHEVEADILLYKEPDVDRAVGVVLHGSSQALFVPDGSLGDVLQSTSRVLLALEEAQHRVESQKADGEAPTLATAAVVFQRN